MRFFSLDSSCPRADERGTANIRGERVSSLGWKDRMRSRSSSPVYKLLVHRAMAVSSIFVSGFSLRVTLLRCFIEGSWRSSSLVNLSSQHHSVDIGNTRTPKLPESVAVVVCQQPKHPLQVSLRYSQQLTEPMVHLLFLTFSRSEYTQALLFCLMV